MWKHLDPKDKHKYYEIATKARSMYVLPENPLPQGKMIFFFVNIALNTFNFSSNFILIKKLNFNKAPKNLLFFMQI